MENIKLLQNLRLDILFVWLMLISYGFYKYCRHTEFRTVSLLKYIFSSLTSTFIGFLTGMVVIDIGFVLLLFFSDICIKVGQYYFQEKTMHTAIALTAYFLIVIMFHYLSGKCNSSILAKLLSAMFLIGLFLLGVAGFFYYLVHYFRK